jgi:DNA-binding transcriptional MocR family regulator
MDEPTARGLARAVGRAVSDGALKPGTRLPPIRTVASELVLSPTTVSSAWNMLVRSGTIQTDGRRGTVITAHHAGPSRYRRVLEHDAGFRLDLSTGTPDPALLPDLRPALRRVESHLTPGSYLDQPVITALQDQLESDWPFRAQRFAVVDGAMDALQLICSAMLHFGDRVAVEDPGFPPLLDLLDAMGVVAVPFAIDDDGPLPHSLAVALESNVRMIVLQPRGQNPTGASLTAERVDELAAVLAHHDAIVVEDDSAGVVASSPALSLGSVLPERVLHVRSYSKSHGPDLRLAAVGGASDLVDPLVDRRFLGQGWTSRLLQTVLVDLLTHDDTVAAVARARDIYAARRTELASVLAGHGIQVGGKDGLNVWIPVHDEASALLRLASRGIGASPGEPFRLVEDAGQHLRVTAGLIANDLPAVADELAAAAVSGVRGGPR